MQIRFTQHTEIRSSSSDLTEQTLIGQVFPHVVVDMEDMMYPGVMISGNDHWFRDANGWYYWSGNAVPVIPEKPAADINILNGAPVNGQVPELPEPDSPILIAVLPEPDDPTFNEEEELLPFGETRVPIDDSIDELMVGNIDWPDGLLQEKDVQNPLLERVSGTLPDIFPQERLNWGVRLLDIQQQYWVNKQARGGGVRIAILGTGIATDCADLDIADAFILAGLGDSINDLDGLGTQAAMAAAGRGHQHCGTAPEAELMIAKIGALHYTITPQAVLEGFDWAVEREADIIVLLTSFSRLDPVMENLFRQRISAAVLRNITVIAPAGESGDVFTGMNQPPVFEEVLTVGSCNELGQRSSFSAKFGKIDLLAPGEGLDVVSYDGQTPVLNTPNTAVAAAFAAGCVALILNDYRLQNKPFSTWKMMTELKSIAFNKQKYGVADLDTGMGYGLLRLPGV